MLLLINKPNATLLGFYSEYKKPSEKQIFEFDNNKEKKANLNEETSVTQKLDSTYVIMNTSEEYTQVNKTLVGSCQSNFLLRTYFGLFNTY